MLYSTLVCFNFMVIVLVLKLKSLAVVLIGRNYQRKCNCIRDNSDGLRLA